MRSKAKVLVVLGVVCAIGFIGCPLIVKKGMWEGTADNGNAIKFEVVKRTVVSFTSPTGQQVFPDPPVRIKDFGKFTIGDPEPDEEDGPYRGLWVEGKIRKTTAEGTGGFIPPEGSGGEAYEFTWTADFIEEVEVEE
jgi:hypothetical protein